MTLDLTDWNDRFNYAREAEQRGPMAPTVDHLTLLKEACWGWDDAEFGAAAMDAKRPYGNSDVEEDLAEHLPHLSREERLRAHCELPAVLSWITGNADVLQAIARSVATT